MALKLVLRLSSQLVLSPADSSESKATLASLFVKSPPAHLVAVKKTVTRSGKTFVQTFYTKPVMAAAVTSTNSSKRLISSEVREAVEKAAPMTERKFNEARSAGWNPPSLDADIPCYQHGKESPNKVSARVVTGYHWTLNRLDDISDKGNTLDKPGEHGSTPTPGEGFVYAHRDPSEMLSLLAAMGKGHIYKVSGQAFERECDWFTTQGAIDAVERIYPVERIVDFEEITQDELEKEPTLYAQYQKLASELGLTGPIQKDSSSILQSLAAIYETKAKKGKLGRLLEAAQVLVGQTIMDDGEPYVKVTKVFVPEGIKNPDVDDIRIGFTTGYNGSLARILSELDHYTLM